MIGLSIFEGDGGLGTIPIECWDPGTCSGGGGWGGGGYIDRQGYIRNLDEGAWGSTANPPPLQPIPTVNNPIPNAGSLPSANCSCLIGTAVVGSDGVCRCVNLGAVVPTAPAATNAQNAPAITQANEFDTKTVLIGAAIILGGILLLK